MELGDGKFEQWSERGAIVVDLLRADEFHEECEGLKASGCGQEI